MTKDEAIKILKKEYIMLPEGRAALDFAISFMRGEIIEPLRMDAPKPYDPHSDLCPVCLERPASHGPLNDRYVCVQKCWGQEVWDLVEGVGSINPIKVRQALYDHYHGKQDHRDTVARPSEEDLNAMLEKFWGMNKGVERALLHSDTEPPCKCEQGHYGQHDGTCEWALWRMKRQS